MKQNEDITLSNQMIDALGGTAALARQCDITMQAVSYWRRVGMPMIWAMYLRLKYKRELKAAGLL